MADRKLTIALQRLEALYEYGALQSATDTVGFINAVCDELSTLRADLAKANAEVERLRQGLRDIRKRGLNCTCDIGYLGPCGCGRWCSETADDVLCLSTDRKYGACGVCAECKSEVAIDAAKGK